MRLFLAAVGLSLLLLASSASAEIYKLDFSVTNYTYFEREGGIPPVLIGTGDLGLVVIDGPADDGGSGSGDAVATIKTFNAAQASPSLSFEYSVYVSDTDYSRSFSDDSNGYMSSSIDYHTDVFLGPTEATPLLIDTTADEYENGSDGVYIYKGYSPYDLETTKSIEISKSIFQENSEDSTRTYQLSRSLRFSETLGGGNLMEFQLMEPDELYVYIMSLVGEEFTLEEKLYDIEAGRFFATIFDDHTGYRGTATLNKVTVVDEIVNAIPTPLPASMALLGAALTGVAWAGRRRR